MSGKLDQALDEIVSINKRQSVGARRGRRGAAGRAAGRPAVPVAPVSGIKKATRPTRTSVRVAVPSGPAAGGDSKVIVSNLPMDVNEGQIKEYFHSTVGPVKKVLITYGPNGTSRGIATVVFSKADGANKALKQLNGVLVDNRPIKIEVVLDASRAPAPAPIKGLSERVAQPKGQAKTAKAQPKLATTTKVSVESATRGRGRGRGKTARGRNAGRGKPKTTEDLDAEMNDYFGGSGEGAPAAEGAPAVINGATVAATNGGDAGMEDEIM
ncbi:MAG: hypothetical protein M1832_003626 [Thelocarpon impressellum]|nr:MAG: hypothetical protein M1832_003626 [Thelocarpon impressellum]